MNIDQAIAELKSFNSLKEIVQFLEREGITGKPFKCSRCPLSNLLKKRTKQRWTVHTGDGIVGRNGDRRNLPWAAVLFARYFDVGRYPQLQSKD